MQPVATTGEVWEGPGLTRLVIASRSQRKRAEDVCRLSQQPAQHEPQYGCAPKITSILRRLRIPTNAKRALNTLATTSPSPSSSARFRGCAAGLRIRAFFIGTPASPASDRRRAPASQPAASRLTSSNSPRRYPFSSQSVGDEVVIPAQSSLEWPPRRHPSPGNGAEAQPVPRLVRPSPQTPASRKD